MNSSISAFQSLKKIFLISFRTCTNKFPKAIQYHGFKYYPRHENFKDPPYTPSKLFLIKRIKSMKGRNPEERNCLERLNIDGEIFHKGHISIVKNIPEINKLLWKIKHLIEIKPIKWTQELPKNKDYSGTYLRETGEFIISPKLKVAQETLETSEKYLNDNHRIDRVYFKSYLLKKWNSNYPGEF